MKLKKKTNQLKNNNEKNWHQTSHKNSMKKK
jgi:hypothetical protein